jgi:PAS domain S-box-containing protein
MKNRILIAILLPVIIVGAVLTIWAATFMVPPLLSFIQKHIDSSLVLVTDLGFDKCKKSQIYLIEHDLANDPMMLKKLQRQVLGEIEILGRQFDNIHLVALNELGEALGDPEQLDVTPMESVTNLPTEGIIFVQDVYKKPARCVARYFPDWQWYVVGYIFKQDYVAPISLAQKIIFGLILVVLLAVVLVSGLAFHFYVNQPLRRIIRATRKVADGQFQKVEVIGKDEIGQVTATFNTMVESLADDQRKINRMLSALRQSEELYRVITENSGSLIILVQKGRIIFANRRALSTLGYKSEELVGQSAIIHLHSDDHAKVRRMARLGFVGRPARGTLECRYYTKQADMRWMELAIVQASFKGEAVLLVHGIEITRRKQAHEEQQRLESKLRQAQKMEAIGTLAGGIAHDFNNLLMGIQGNVSLLSLVLPDRPPLKERLRNIERYVKNGSELTRQLLGYARGGKYQVKSICINDLVKQSAHMFGRTKKEIVIHYDLEPKGWSVEVDRGQIEQVLLNLYVNAWQAMPGGGHLYLKTRNRELSAYELKDRTGKFGQYVQISVTDTGIGMDQQTLQRIYDPFFTTKQRERGTGLGLASAYGIIKNHEGVILCKSRAGEGTCFDIFLPRTDKLPTQEPTVDEEIKVGTETILLVDDEEMVLEVGRDLLAYLGYMVICTNNGRQALKFFNKDPWSYDLVLLDMVMPEMGGPEVFKGLRKVRPDIPVLLCSGYSLSGPAAELVAHGCNGFIQKPFDLDVLSHQLRRILDKRVQDRSAAGRTRVVPRK